MPRIVVGMYLDDTYKSLLNEIGELQNRGKPQIIFEVVSKEVSAVDFDPKVGCDVLSFTDRCDPVTSNFTILATGNNDNQLYQELLGTPSYFPYHYRVEKDLETYLKAYKIQDLKVLVLGTRLSGIDGTVLAYNLLKGNQNVKNFKITMASRDGVLPMVRVPPIPGSSSTLKHLNSERITQEIKAQNGKISSSFFQQLFEQELSDAYGHPVTVGDLLQPSKEGRQLETLRLEVELMQKGNAPWYQLRSALLENIDLIWTYLPPQEKLPFIQKYFNSVLRIINAFPMQNAKNLLEYQKAGYLSVKGGLESVTFEKESGQYKATFKPTQPG